MSVKSLVHQYLGSILKDPTTTLNALRQALNESEAMLENVTVGDVIGTHTPTPVPTPTYTRAEPTPSVLTQCVETLKAHEGMWLTASDLAMVVDAQPVYITKVLQEAIRDIQTFPVLMHKRQLHSAGRPTPHFKFIHLTPAE